ncbi:tail fiber domain-containing protein [Citrobacter sp. Cf111]|uniref:tail fiber domain-containing protein n=1 Tax=Citrobacter sp. Cf111 TaxID=2985064 RepID=UPI002576ACD1|nr:tail fiber domain-containing protein [Citrobacter sp. Cf111]MDM3168108.1 tail fiber domain-containing protein [Citrobacter sp. Cf111]MDM3169676.1 tail fiber domain-containing protein [Citrobacter sp. Cf111]MDM3169711.1 tail fiber domain-containing protein [Citrobacter sp. Cf111]MDM3169747.1 tail fiber domain-containing protein [Citrobacter sp. Cf111]
MSAGTLTLTNNSAAVAGSGTAFTTEVAAGDFIVVTVGGVPYTLPIKSVESGTALTLVSNFTGPTQSGAAWSAVPRVALNMVTAALVAQSTEALRGLNYDKQNWQQVYSGAGSITVKLPDGTTFTGPSWKYLSDNMATKSDGAVPVNQGGTGGKTKEDARTNLGLGNSSTRNIGTVTGTVAAGDDSRLNTVNGKASGVVKGDFFTLDNSYGHTTQLLTYSPGTVGTYFGGMSMKRPNSQGWILSQYTTTDYEVQSVTIGIDAPGANVNWIFNRNGQATGTWVNNSDSRIKKDIKPIPDPLVAMKKIRGCSWTRLDSGVTGFGFIAQEVRKVFPEAVHDFGQTMTMEDGKEVENVLSVDTSGVSAALHHEAILALIVEIEELKTEMKSLTGVGR